MKGLKASSATRGNRAAAHQRFFKEPEKFISRNLTSIIQIKERERRRWREREGNAIEKMSFPLLLQKNRFRCISKVPDESAGYNM
jgi:hypothetical protein